MKVKKEFLGMQLFKFWCVLIVFLAACTAMAQNTILISMPTPGTTPAPAPVTTPAVTTPSKKKSIGNGLDLPVVDGNNIPI